MADLTIRDSHAFMPALDIEQAVDRFRTLVRFVESVMREGVDYGTIPGTEKPTLYKPGAEKLCTLFGLSCHFRLERAIEDWSGKDHGGEPLFYYVYRCQLYRGDLLVAEADGSCNSREGKYRWRYADRTCPQCGEAAIIKGREEYGGGWLCWRKKGGCGAKYVEGDPAIEEQEAGRILNEDVASLVNTIQKMASKRALVAATLIAVNASEFFTQDLEDFRDQPQQASEEETGVVEGEARPASSRSRGPAPSEELINQFDALGREVYGPDWEHKRRALISHVTSGRAFDPTHLTEQQVQRLINGMRQKTGQPVS